MPRAAGTPDAGSGLRALAQLVLDSVAGTAAGWLATPAWAGPAGGPGLMLSVVPPTTDPQRRPASARPTPGRRPRPGPAPRLPDQGDPVDEQLDEQVDEHADSWELVRRAQDGSGEAFGQLYDRYVSTVYRFVYYRVNDRALAEDFTSETFLRALRRIGSFTYQGRDIGAWLVTIARNIVLDHVKSARNRLEFSTADAVEGREQVQSTEAAVLETLTAERLMSAVDMLGAEQRECVVLRFIQGLSLSETAAAMDKNDGAVKALQHRAVRKLGELLGDELR
jgi:RNA polymerase sigma-70 factor (ECF subfamily)